MDLMGSVKNNDLENIIELLLNDNINVNFQDEVGNTALIWAVHYGFDDIVDKLINYSTDIDVNIRNTRGNTALIWASIKNKSGVVNLLLNHHNINVNVQDEEGNTALIWAAFNGHNDIVEALLQFDNININIKGHNDIVEALLQFENININIKNKNGLTALNLATLQGHFDVILALISHPNIDLNINIKFKDNMLLHRNRNGNVLLHEVLSRNCGLKFIQDIVKTCPSCVSIENNDHKTPLDIAFENELSVEIVAILLINSSNSNSILSLFGSNKYSSHQIYGPLLELLKSTTYNSIVRLHLCGFDGVGKTTLRNCIESSLKNYFFSDVADVSQSTIGMNISTFNDNGIKFVVFDYGGQSEYHVNHSRFLNGKNSIYVIVLSLCKFRNEKGKRLTNPLNFTEDDLADLCNKYNYWLKFINITTSKTNNDSMAHVITCLNYHRSLLKYNPAIVEAAIQRISDVQTEWFDQKSHLNRINFVNVGGNIAVIDVKSTKSVKNKLLSILRDKANEIAESSVSNFKVVDKIISMRDHRNWFDVGPRSEFKSIVMNTFPKDLSGNIKNGLAEAVLTQLELIGEVFTFDYNDIKSFLIVTNPNKLCSNILGKLANYLNKKKKRIVSKDLKSYSISKEEILNISSNIKCSLDIHNDIVIELLELLGVCIKCSDGNFFPVFAADAGIIQETNIFELNPELKQYSRRVHRRFKLSDTKLQMFPRGYFPSLFVYISLMATIEGNFQLYTNAILIPERGRVSNEELPHMETIVKISDDSSYFDVIVQSWFNQSPSNHIDERRYINRLNEIKVLIYDDPKFVYYNMEIVEYAVHPDPEILSEEVFVEIEQHYKVYKEANSAKCNDVLPWLFGISGNKCGIDPQISSTNPSNQVMGMLESVEDSLNEVVDRIHDISSGNKSLHEKIDSILSNPNLSPNKPILPPLRKGPDGSSANR